MNKIFFLLFLVLPLPGFSASFKSEKAVLTSIKISEASTLSVKVLDGFHINQEAPNQVTILPGKRLIKANELSPKFATFTLGKLAATESVQLSLYVCDDALTTCEVRTWVWNADGKVSDAGPTTVAIPEAIDAHAVIKNGFIQDSLPAALKECGKKRHQVLLLFSARWCPGCMRMEKEVWTNPKLKAALDLFTKVHLDADRFANRATMEKYGVAGIPTTLILDCDGEELERYVDYQEPMGFKSALTMVAKKNDLRTHKQLLKRADLGEEESANILARRAALSGDNPSALKWYGFVSERQKDILYWWALTDDSSQKQEKSPSPENKKQFITNLQEAIAAFPEAPSSLDWRSQLAEQLGSETKEGIAILDALITLCDQLIQDPSYMKRFNAAEPAGDYLGIESLKVFQAKASALEAEKKVTEAKTAWAAAVQEGARLGIKDEPSGKFFRFLTILKSAGEKERVEKFFQKYLAKNPKDPELLRRYGKFLFENGDYKGAAEKAMASIAGSYDQNELFAALLYAQATAKAGDVKRAKDFLFPYLQRHEISDRSKAEISSTLMKLEKM